MQIMRLATLLLDRSCKMDNIKIHQVELINGEIAECVIIDRGNGEYTSMPKSTYDEQQAALSTPMINDEPATKSK